VVKYSAGLVTIATAHFDRVWAFYAHLLGQEPQPFTPHIYAEFRLPGICLGIFRPQANSPFIPGRGAMSLCLEVDDLALAIERAIQGGCPRPTTISTASHGRETYIYDPDDNRIILHQGPNAPPPP
jgi:predicted enzyme related to lactoylglutathione lyase